VRSSIAVSLIGLGAIAALREQATRAVHLWAQARKLYKRRDGLSELEPQKWLRTILRTHLLSTAAIEAVNNELGNSTLAAWNAGQSLTLEQILSRPETPARTPMPEQTEKSVPPLVDALTPREKEVLLLLAQGLSNPLIAQRLVIGLSTVNTHVRNIYSKLGVSSRSAATRYAVEHHLI
jgi:DNA-binding NarL/FixJ family response regulator